MWGGAVLAERKWVDLGAVDRCDDGDDALAVIAVFEMLTGQIFLANRVGGPGL